MLVNDLLKIIKMINQTINGDYQCQDCGATQDSVTFEATDDLFPHDSRCPNYPLAVHYQQLEEGKDGKSINNEGDSDTKVYS